MIQADFDDKGEQERIPENMTCSASTALLTKKEIDDRISRLDGWSFDQDSIAKSFEFKNFLKAISFVNAVAYIAETLNHHPDIRIHYNQVTLTNWTHAAGGVTEHDIVLARRIDLLIHTRDLE